MHIYRLSLLIAALAIYSSARPADSFQNHIYRGDTGDSICYSIFIPDNYDSTQRYPLVLVFHNGGARGRDWDHLTDYGHAELWAQVENQQRYPCFVLSPQCPREDGVYFVDSHYSKGSYSIDEVPMSWVMRYSLALLDSVIAHYSIDTLRLYTTGLSVGGYGAWDAILRRPHTFAAAVPCCGAGDPQNAHRIAHMPIWMFHGSKDNVVPTQATKEMYAALIEAGGDTSQIKMTLFSTSGHGVCGQAYNQDGLMEWVFSHEKEQVTPVLEESFHTDKPSYHSTCFSKHGIIIYTLKGRNPVLYTLQGQRTEIQTNAHFLFPYNRNVK
jgi:predicted peptidase